MSEFSRRWKEEESPACLTPVVGHVFGLIDRLIYEFDTVRLLQTHRLTPAIRRAFVKTLRTPALLSIFSKDPVSMAYAQASLRVMALLEPALIMPELLERA